MPMDHPALAATSAAGPDIYLVLLDGHPRGDTMRDDFGLDSDRLLEPLEQLGFEVADQAHRINFTALTLASMFDMEQIGSIDGLDDHQSPAVQYRELARTINSGAALGQLRNLGYEIVTVPSPAGVVTLHSADRVVADGSITQFEFSLLELGINPLLAPDVQRTLVMGSLRGRVLRSLEQTVELAKERGGRPKLVFTHVMSPARAPVLFAADGTVRRAAGRVTRSAARVRLRLALRRRRARAARQARSNTSTRASSKTVRGQSSKPARNHRSSSSSRTTAGRHRPWRPGGDAPHAAGRRSPRERNGVFPSDAYAQ